MLKNPIFLLQTSIPLILMYFKTAQRFLFDSNNSDSVRLLRGTS